MQINIHTCEIGHKILGQIPKYQSREFIYVKSIFANFKIHNAFSNK